MNKIRNTTSAATMLLALCLCAGSNRLQAQSVYEPYTFTIFAGGGGFGSADGTGSAARFYNPSGVATDAAGNVYVADTYNHTIRKITPAGAVSTFAGLAGTAGSADGTGSAARFNRPWGVATDAAGNVYVADSGNDTIRKITPAGVVSTLAGLAGPFGSGSADGTGSEARFYLPSGVATDAAGSVYVADQNNHTIRKVTPAGEVTTLVGLAGTSGSADGTGSAARFNYPSGVATDASGDVYVADTYNSTIRKITPAGVVSTLAGFEARFALPSGVATDASGNVYVADTGNDTIRKITPAGVVTTLAGAAGSDGSADGTGSAARFRSPRGVATDASGNVYVADTGNDTIRKITPAGVVSTFAGLAGTAGSADGTGSVARFNGPAGVATDASGNVYVADTLNNTIRKITPAGVVTTLAGLAGSDGSADGTGSAARFWYPHGVATDASGNVYVADSGNDTIRKITPARVVTTLAGLAGPFGSGSADGTGSAARFNNPVGVATDASGNVYVADQANHTIRKITPARVVTTLAGLAGPFGGSADGTGSAARFNSPHGVATDASGNVYVADRDNDTIRKITPAGVVSTLAGLAGNTGSADGTGSAARFFWPEGVATDASGNIYVADTQSYTIRKVTPAGVVSTLAGLAGTFGSADGTGSAARFNSPTGVATALGNVYVADRDNNGIRKGFIPPPPIITCPGNITAECTGGLTPVTYNVTARDSAGNPLPVTCVPPSGSGFRLGVSNVVCMATNASGGTASCGFTVTVVDTTPPQVTCNSNIVAAATSPDGADVTYIASAFDACGIGSLDCSPPSGSTFPVGQTTVTCRATDSVGNSNQCSFTVTVQAVPPAITCPGNITAECTGGLTPVTYNVSAMDSAGNPLSVTCRPPSGSGFRLGVSNVACMATDAFSSTVSCGFTVTVVDTTPPQVTCSSNTVAAATSPDGAVVTYIAGASDACGIGSFDCSPSSGSTFPVGQTTVTCRATDSLGHPNQCSFTVTVQQPPTARIAASPLVDFSPTPTNLVLIAANGSNACLVLDGSSSSDPESPNSALTFAWFVQPPGIPLASGPIATNCVQLDTYTYTLVVTDPQGASSTDTLTIDVLTPCEAEGALILMIEKSELPRNVQRPLVSSVKAACASFEKDGVNTGINQLQAFQSKVRTHVRPLDLVLAKQLEDGAQAIIDALAGL